MYVSDNMQLCMDKYLLCMQVILAFMHGSMFDIIKIYNIFYLWTNVAYFINKCVPCDKDVYSILGH
jgi:hypothetical protein